MTTEDETKKPGMSEATTKFEHAADTASSEAAPNLARALAAIDLWFKNYTINCITQDQSTPNQAAAIWPIVSQASLLP